MKTEVTLRIFDPEGRDGQEWAEMLTVSIQDAGGEVIEAEDEEV